MYHTSMELQANLDAKAFYKDGLQKLADEI